MAFVHRPLQSNALRLLKPVTIGHDNLAFEISHHPREATPPYTAVSYTWGDGAPTEQISINGQEFRVRINLWSCLHYLGKAVKPRSGSCKYLWVDAICIDQNNDQERNAQVRLMDQIYRNAIVVSVWLGLPPMSGYMRAQLVDYREPIKTFEIDNFDWFDSMEDLANRPYWGRFWVIQEFLLGQDVHIYCGNTRVEWLHFRTLLGQASGIHDDFSEDVNYTRSPTGSWAAWPLVTGRHPDKHPELQQSLYKLLITYGSSNCKDTRDRVFALLGLVTLQEKSLLERFLPDYTMSEDNVIVIALCHVQLGVFNTGREHPDLTRVLLALGVNSESRQRRLIRRSHEYDYLGDEPPNPHWNWFDDREANDFDVSIWRNIASPVYGDFDIRSWGGEQDTRAVGRPSRRFKRAVYMIGVVAILVMFLKAYRPQIWTASVSFILTTVPRFRRLASSLKGQNSDIS